MFKRQTALPTPVHSPMLLPEDDYVPLHGVADLQPTATAAAERLKAAGDTTATDLYHAVEAARGEYMRRKDVRVAFKEVFGKYSLRESEDPLASDRLASFALGVAVAEEAGRRGLNPAGRTDPRVHATLAGQATMRSLVGSEVAKRMAESIGATAAESRELQQAIRDGMVFALNAGYFIARGLPASDYAVH